MARQSYKRDDGHDNEHGHGHDHHGHSHAISGEKNLFIAIFLNAAITAAEIIGGIMSGSLALLSDAFHNLSDAVALAISYIAMLVSRRSKTTAKTYGYKRAEILAALANVIALFFVCGFIIYEALSRLKHPEPVKTGLMLAVAFVGLAGNGISMLMLFKESKNNINIKSAFLHMLGDAVSSVAVILTAFILMFRPWYFLDAVISILISLYIVKESFGILMDSVNILMQGTPRGVEHAVIKKRLYALKQLKIMDIHHIHVWDISPGHTVFDAHIAVKKANLKNADRIISDINRVLSKEFNIRHSTIQLESEDFNHCVTCDL